MQYSSIFHRKGKKSKSKNDCTPVMHHLHWEMTEGCLSSGSCPRNYACILHWHVLLCTTATSNPRLLQMQVPALLLKKNLYIKIMRWFPNYCYHDKSPLQQPTEHYQILVLVFNFTRRESCLLICSTLKASSHLRCIWELLICNTSHGNFKLWSKVPETTQNQPCSVTNKAARHLLQAISRAI